MSPELRPEWRCDGCRVVVYVPGKDTPAPKGWDHAAERCKACVKQAAREAAERGEVADDQPRGWHDKAGPTDGDVPATAAERAAAELRRDAARSDRDVAEASNTSRRTVAAVRKKLGLRSQDARQQRTGAAAARVEPLLTADPSRSNAEIATEAEVSQSTVRAVRRRLGLSLPEYDRRGRRPGR